MSDIQDQLSKAAAALRNAEAILVSAGAGLGVDSGLPDFRGDQGFWKAYPALRGFAFSDMANPSWFRKDPSRAWGFYGHRLNLYRETVPHDGFRILRQWSEGRNSFVFTSNVDGQFQRGGFSESEIYECHGSIHWLQELDPEPQGEIWSADGTDVEVDTVSVRALGELPVHPRTGRLARPNVLMFGDWDWVDSRSRAQAQRLESWLSVIDLGSTVVVEVGAGTALPTVRHFGERLLSAGGALVRVNPRESHGPAGTISIPMGGLEGLSAIQESLS